MTMNSILKILLNFKGLTVDKALHHPLEKELPLEIPVLF